MRETRRDAFERLYETQAEGLFAFLVYRTGDPSLAEDVLADAFERVLTARPSFDPRRGSEKTWLYSIALNRLRDHQRRAVAESRALERMLAGRAESGSYEVDVDVGSRDAVLRALGTLSDDEREAVALRYGADLSIREIATVVQRPTTTVKGRLYHGLRKLRQQL